MTLADFIMRGAANKPIKRGHIFAVTASGGMLHGAGAGATIGSLQVMPSGGMARGGSAGEAVVPAAPAGPPMPGGLITQGFWIGAAT